MELSLFKIILILVIVFVIFGAGKLPNVMGDIGKGIRSLKGGLKGDEQPMVKPEEPKQVVEINQDKTL